MRARRIVNMIFTAAMTAGLAGNGWAQEKAAEPSKAASTIKEITSIEGITEYRLPNGLIILLYPDQSQPKVTVNLTMLVGSRHEGYGETGMAHLLEHMVFKGTPTHSQIPKLLGERGAVFNGSTSLDRTNYYETMNASDDNLEFAIKLEADRMVNSYIKGEDLASEMTVVRSEFEQGENQPTRVLMQRMMGVAYEWHNYGKSTIGNRSDIERVPVERLQNFYRKFYQPDNAMLVVAGSFNSAKALEMIEKYFGAIPKPQRTLETTYTLEPPQDGDRTVTLRRVGDIASVALVYHIPAASHPDSVALDVMEAVLTSAPNGLLYKELVEGKLTASVGGNTEAGHDPGVIGFSASVLKGQSPEVVRDKLIAALESKAADSITAAEVERTKRRMILARERSVRDTNRVAINLSEWGGHGDWRLFFLHRDWLEQVTTDQVKAVAKKYLVQNNRTLGMFLPTEGPQRVYVPSSPDLKAQLANYKGRDAVVAGEAFDVAPEKIEARIERVTQPDLPKMIFLKKKTKGEQVTVLVSMHYGNAQNLKGLTEAAAMLPSLMTVACKGLDHEQLSDELTRLKATLGSGGGGGGRGGRRGGGGGGGAAGNATFSVSCPKQNLAEVMDLLRRVLHEPAFPEKEFDVRKRQGVTFREFGRKQPAAQAQNWLSRQFAPYAKDDVRYVPTLDEAIERQRAVTLAQVQKLHSDYLSGENVEVAVVGDFDKDVAVESIKKCFAGWKAKMPYQRIDRPFVPRTSGAATIIATPDMANAVYLAGISLPMRDDDPDYPALEIANYVLGQGALSSRLGDRLRQKEGLSYGASSSFRADPFDRNATLAIQAICNPTNLPKLQKAAAEEMARFAKDGITSAELESAKKGLLDARQVGRANEAFLAPMLISNAHLGRTMLHMAEHEKKIKELTVEQVNAAIKKHIDFQKLVVVSAGDVDEPPSNGQ